GAALRRRGDAAGARDQLERAVASAEATYGPSHPLAGAYRASLGGALWDLGDAEGARRETARALAITRAAYGPDHPDTKRTRAWADEPGVRPDRDAPRDPG